MGVWLLGATPWPARGRSAGGKWVTSSNITREEELWVKWGVLLQIGKPVIFYRCYSNGLHSNMCFNRGKESPVPDNQCINKQTLARSWHLIATRLHTTVSQLSYFLITERRRVFYTLLNAHTVNIPRTVRTPCRNFHSGSARQHRYKRRCSFHGLRSRPREWCRCTFHGVASVLRGKSGCWLQQHAWNKANQRSAGTARRGSTSQEQKCKI